MGAHSLCPCLYKVINKQTMLFEIRIVATLGEGVSVLLGTDNILFPDLNITNKYIVQFARIHFNKYLSFALLYTYFIFP